MLTAAPTDLRRLTALPPPREPARRGSRRTGAKPALLLLAALCAAAWLPFLHRPLGSDESGFLLLARQWHPGTSLYGNYWVDRPPLLLELFALAGHMSPLSSTAVGVVAPGVRVLGAFASGVAVLLTGALGSVVERRSHSATGAAAVLATALLCTPLFGMPETDGEVLAVPFVLIGLVCLVAATRHPWSRRTALLATAAGASGAAAALVKQNVIDVLVFAAALFWVSRRRTDRLARRIAVFAGGSLAVLTAAVAGAAVRGTSPAGLWAAVVVFRLQASRVISVSASAATPLRLAHLVVALAVSGGALVLLVTAAWALDDVRRRRRLPHPGSVVLAAGDADALVVPALVLVAWEVCGVALGGSYWLHYLTGLVPGAVLLMALTRLSRARAGLLGATLAYTVAASVVVWLHQTTAPVVVTPDARVMSYLRAHASRSDGLVVDFGHPDIVAGSGLRSPYPLLWSLPVRVRDPRLASLHQVLSGPDAPRWMVVAGAGLDSWGLDAQRAQHYVEQHYVEQVTYDNWHIWQRRRSDER